MVETIFCVWRTREYRQRPDEGRIDWRETREEAIELKEELDEDTDCEHEVIEEVRMPDSDEEQDSGNDFRIK